MNAPAHHGGWVIVASVFVALVLTVLPLPDEIGELRPEWTVLVLIYWSLALPQRVGVGVSWLVGILQDVLQATLLGAHALAFALVAYLTMKLYQRIRVFPLWQQALTVLVLLLTVQVLLLWVRGLTGNPGADWDYWLPALVGTLAWPVVFVILRELRRRFQVQ